MFESEFVGFKDKQDVKMYRISKSKNPVNP
jgi:hypothetical protein